MGVREVMLLVMVLSFFCSSASFTQVSKNLVPGKIYENIGNNKIDEKSSTNGVGSGIVNQSKYTTDITGDITGGGHHVGSGEGQSNSSPQGGGNGMVPVYGAGAAAQRRNHKGGAITYTPSLKGWFAMLIAISASLLLYVI